MLREEILGTRTLVSFEGINLETSEKRYPPGRTEQATLVWRRPPLGVSASTVPPARD